MRWAASAWAGTSMRLSWRRRVFLLVGEHRGVPDDSCSAGCRLTEVFFSFLLAAPKDVRPLNSLWDGEAAAIKDLL